MCKPPEGGLQPADHQRNFHAIGLSDSLAVDDHRTVWPLACLAAGRVSILAPLFFGRRVMGHHRIDIAGGNQKAQPRLSKPHKILCAMPIRLGEHRNFKAGRLQHPGDDCRAEARVIDIGVARNINKIGPLPSSLLHLFHCDR